MKCIKGKSQKKKRFQNYCCRVCLSCSSSSSSQQVYYDANFLLYEPNQNFVDGILASSDPYSSIKAFRERIPTLLKVCLCIQDQLKFTFFHHLAAGQSHHRAYGNMGCSVSKKEYVQNQKDFCQKINIPKGNYHIF